MDKCAFEQTEASFLGCIVTRKSIPTYPAKTQDNVDWPRPNNRKEVQRILGSWNLYRIFIPNYAQIVAPNTDLLKRNGNNFHFGEAQETAFLKIVILFTSGNTLILTNCDPERPSLIETDASDFTVGVVLSQKFEDGKIHPCAYLSPKLSPAEFNYDVFDKEMLAIVYALQNWRHYVLETEHTTTIFSNHHNPEYFTNMVKLDRRQARWAEILPEFDFVIIYRKYSLNHKADILSRCPAYTIREEGTTAISEKLMLGRDKWLEVGSVEIYNETL